jgi:hypothetical protein
MKRVSILKLNLQQENVLSREERKKVLGGDIGGSFPTACYVRCNTGNGSIGPYPTSTCSSSSGLSGLCVSAGGNGTYQCSCNGPF